MSRAIKQGTVATYVPVRRRLCPTVLVLRFGPVGKSRPIYVENTCPRSWPIHFLRPLKLKKAGLELTTPRLTHSPRSRQNPLSCNAIPSFMIKLKIKQRINCFCFERYYSFSIWSSPSHWMTKVRAFQITTIFVSSSYHNRGTP